MASAPHGGILKVRPLVYSSWPHLDTIPLKDLLTRDQDIHHLLKEESLTLDDITLSDVRIVLFSPCLQSFTSRTPASALRPRTDNQWRI
jgi:hypothetical protein